MTWVLMINAVFCSPPECAECPTCGTHLHLGDYGGKPAVMARKKKKWKKGPDEATGVAA